MLLKKVSLKRIYSLVCVFGVVLSFASAAESKINSLIMGLLTAIFSILGIILVSKYYRKR